MYQPVRRLVVLALVLACGAAAIIAAAPTSVTELHVDQTADGVDARPGDGVCATAGWRCTLRAAIQEANALPGLQLIVIPAGVYMLTRATSREDAGASGDLDVTADVELRGAGAQVTVIDGGSHDRVLDIAPSGQAIATTLSGLTLRNGAPPSDFVVDDD